jgi:hypothetical protein
MSSYKLKFLTFSQVQSVFREEDLRWGVNITKYSSSFLRYYLLVKFLFEGIGNLVWESVRLCEITRNYGIKHGQIAAELNHLYKFS